MRFYRIHPAGESLDTLLDPTRPDGWVADDESPETQPRGISACDDLDALHSYIREYSMAIRPGDRLVCVHGVPGDEARDMHETRVVVASYEDMGDAVSWAAARE